MIELRLLGSVGLVDTGRGELRAVLAQPKRLALLAYLGTALPRGFHRRDSLLALFWPERDQSSARAALSRAVYYLRHALGEGILLGRGDEELGLSDELWCDVSAFEQAIAGGRFDDALALYRGDLLEGFFVSDAPEFEAWLERTRARLAELFSRSLEAAASARSERGDRAGALDAWRQLVRRERGSARATLGLMQALESAGDRAAALQQAALYTQWLRCEFDVEPAPEVTAYASRLQREPATPRRVFARADGVGRHDDAVPLAVDASAGRNARWRPAFVALGIVALSAIAGFAVMRATNLHAAVIDRRVLVVPFANATGTPALDAWGDAAADNLTRALVESRLADVVDVREIGNVPGRSNSPALRQLARRLRAGRVLRGSYYTQGDSLRFEPQIIESQSGKLVETVPPVVVSTGAPSSATELLRQRVLAVFAVLADTTFDAWQVSSHPATYDAYLEYAAANSADAQVHPEQTLEHLARANALDSNFTFPLLALSWWSDCRVTDSIMARIGRRLERLPVIDRAGLSRARARCHGERDVEVKAARALYAAAPKSKWAAKNFAWSVRHNNYFGEALVAMERLDRVQNRGSLLYWGNLIIPYHLLGMHERELAVVREARRFIPENREVIAFEGRALAALGRLDELYALLDTMESVPANSDQVGSAARYMRQISRELHVHGYSNESQRVVERAITWLRAHDAPGQREELAFCLYDAKHWDEAFKVTEQIVREDSSNMRFRALLGALAARRSDYGIAARTDAWLASLTGPYLRGDNTLERSRLAAILGARTRADTLLRQALDEGFAVTTSVGPHDDPDFDSIRDMPAFKRLYRDKSKP